MKISFDAKKDIANQAKHGVSLENAQLIDWDTVLAMPDVRRDYGELREIGYGLIGDRLHCIVFVQRAQSLHVISLRKANSREVRNYVNQT
jgi:uncharacterized DUF497 family protein